MDVKSVPCSCTQVSFANRAFWDCRYCGNRRRTPMVLDLRGKAFQPGEFIPVPDGWDFDYDILLRDSPDRRSDMIRLLDDPAWRQTLAEALRPPATVSGFSGYGSAG